MLLSGPVASLFYILPCLELGTLSGRSWVPAGSSTMIRTVYIYTLQGDKESLLSSFFGLCTNYLMNVKVSLISFSLGNTLFLDF